MARDALAVMLVLGLGSALPAQDAAGAREAVIACLVGVDREYRERLREIDCPVGEDAPFAAKAAQVLLARPFPEIEAWLDLALEETADPRDQTRETIARRWAERALVVAAAELASASGFTAGPLAEAATGRRAAVIATARRRLEASGLLDGALATLLIETRAWEAVPLFIDACRKGPNALGMGAAEQLRRITLRAPRRDPPLSLADLEDWTRDYEAWWDRIGARSPGVALVDVIARREMVHGGRSLWHLLDHLRDPEATARVENAALEGVLDGLWPSNRYRNGEADPMTLADGWWSYGRDAAFLVYYLRDPKAALDALARGLARNAAVEGEITPDLEIAKARAFAGWAPPALAADLAARAREPGLSPFDRARWLAIHDAFFPPARPLPRLLAISDAPEGAVDMLRYQLHCQVGENLEDYGTDEAVLRRLLRRRGF